MMGGDVFDLSDTSFETFTAGFLYAGLEGDVLVAKYGLDVGAEYYCAAGEVPESEDCLDLVAGWKAFAWESHWGGEAFVPLG